MTDTGILKRHRTLVANFGYLSALEVARLVFPLFTYPYLIRVLKPEVYGSIIFAQGLTGYYSVLINFGFQTTATQEVAQVRDDPQRLNETVSTTLQAQILLWTVCLLLHVLLVFAIPGLAQNKLLYLVTFGSTISDVLFPAWYFQGIERMRYITLISCTSRLLTVFGVFAFVHQQSDYLILPVISAAASVVSSVAAISIMLRHGVKLSLQPISRVRKTMAGSAPLFYSNGFGSIADQGGTLVVGAVLGTAELAYYNLAEKVIRLASAMYWNMARTLYPNLARSRNKEMSRKATRIVFMLGLAGSVVVGVGAPWIVALIGGERMAPAVGVLRSLAPYIVFTAIGPLLVNVLMFEGKRGTIFANTMIASVVYVGALALLALGHSLTIYTVAAAFLASIVVRVVHRFWVVKHNGLTDWLYA
jgi:O-antigen/teichoic acid export membrane protein